MRDQKHIIFSLILLLILNACAQNDEKAATTSKVEQTPDGAVLTTNTVASSDNSFEMPRPFLEGTEGQLIMVALDCGDIGVNELGLFANDGSLDGQFENFINTCFYIRHPQKGSLIWDTGLPGLMAGQMPSDSGAFQISLDLTLTAQLENIGVDPDSIDYVSLSHSHFDHIGQIDQFAHANWLIHAEEWAHIKETSAAESADSSVPMELYERIEKTLFNGNYDVFGDGSVLIMEAAGHTPGHTYLVVYLPQTGPVMLSGDLYHRVASRNADDPSLSKIPRFNTDEAQTRASMATFEAHAKELGAKVIIQHAPESFDKFPTLMQ